MCTTQLGKGCRSLMMNHYNSMYNGLLIGGIHTHLHDYTQHVYILLEAHIQLSHTYCQPKTVLNRIPHSTPQYTTVHNGILQYTTVYHSTPQYTTVHHGILQYTTVYYSTPQYTTVHHGIYYITLAHTHVINWI